jgi:hypothetical protein
LAPQQGPGRQIAPPTKAPAKEPVPIQDDAGNVGLIQPVEMFLWQWWNLSQNYDAEDTFGDENENYWWQEAKAATP